ncbi:MAG TPA: acyl-CoA dehydrogenase family protein [Thermoanaerobaculia bacterium]|jgi:alkylation response protein AidB-like acyl-CoA dehydrogenase
MPATPSILSEDLLRTFLERAPVYDRENRFFAEDFEDLKKAGYLKMAVPKKFGGLGLTLAECMKETRRLAYWAPATALGSNMHVYWCGVAAQLHNASDHGCDWMLDAAGKGEVFAAGHAETGNDLPVLLSTTKAERVDGGYRFTGRKAFGSLSPVWTFLGLHGMDTSDPVAPKVVHGFLERAAKGYRIEPTWDVMGMRATKSDDTILEGAFVPDARIARVVAPGAGGVDLFVLSIFAWALTGFANVYYGLGRRVLDLTLASLAKRTALAVSTSMAHHPFVQQGVAEMVMDLETIEPLLDRTAQDWSDGVDHGGAWPSKIVTCKHRAVEGVWRVVDAAMELSGGFGMFKKSELERLFRDARAGRFHPANSALTHELVAKTALGINPDDQPRWG